MFDRGEPDPTAGVTRDVLECVDALLDRETAAFERLKHIGDCAAQDQVTYSLRPWHDPDAWDERSCYLNPDGYESYVLALEAAVDGAEAQLETPRRTPRRHLLGGAST